MFKIIVIFFSIFLSANQGNCVSIPELMNKYTRPITILYISENPKWLNVRENDVVVYWTQNSQFIEKVQRDKPHNCVIITKTPSAWYIKEHSEFNVYDVAILDSPPGVEDTIDSYHLADHNFIFNPSDKLMLRKIDDSLYYFHLPKEYIKQRTHRKHVMVRSDFDKKEMIKTYTIVLEDGFDGGIKTFAWQAGFSLREFYLYKGVYPNDDVIWEQIVDRFDPLVSHDYKIKNMILTGVGMYLIDYDPQNIMANHREESDMLYVTKFHILKYKTYSYVRVGDCR